MANKTENYSMTDYYVKVTNYKLENYPRDYQSMLPKEQQAHLMIKFHGYGHFYSLFLVDKKFGERKVGQITMDDITIDTKLIQDYSDGLMMSIDEMKILIEFSDKLCENENKQRLLSSFNHTLDNQ